MNLVQLRKSQEHLRDTVFWTGLGESLLFEDFESALAYASECRKQHTRLPPLYTIKGERVDPSGALNPTKGSGNIPDNLPYIFGQMPVADSEEFKSASQGIYIYIYSRFFNIIVASTY